MCTYFIIYLHYVFFQSYSFAATCSSATPSEEVEVPNPVPIEVQKMGKDTKKTVEKEEDTVEKAAIIPDDRNGTVEQIGNATQNLRLKPQTNLVEQLHDKVANGKSVIGIQIKNEDVPVENSNLKVNSNDIVANIRTANNNSIVFGNMDS